MTAALFISLAFCSVLLWQTLPWDGREEPSGATCPFVHQSPSFRLTEFLHLPPPQACVTPISSATAARSMASWECDGSAKCALTMTCAHIATWTTNMTWATRLSVMRRRILSRKYSAPPFSRIVHHLFVYSVVTVPVGPASPYWIRGVKCRI